MAVSYDLAQVTNEEKLRDLRLELAPRNQCRDYIREHGGKAELVTKEEFNQLARQKQFKEGPFQDSFGDGYGEPYNPNRQVFGSLDDGRIIFAELVKHLDDKINELIQNTSSSPQ